MEIIDLSHPLLVNMPVFPGSEPPSFQTVSTLKHDGYAEKRMTFLSHTGTHIDAPSHIIEGGLTIDKFSADNFVGLASVLDFSLHPRQTIEIDDLTPNRYLIEKCDFLLICTDWSRFWGKPSYFTGYPVLSEDSVAFLAEFHLKGIGVDTVSVDRPESKRFQVHRRLLQHNIIIIENLTRLCVLPQSGFIFSALPLKILYGDGSPVRAIAMII